MHQIVYCQITNIYVHVVIASQEDSDSVHYDDCVNVKLSTVSID